MGTHRNEERRISVVGKGVEMAGRKRESCSWTGGVDGME